MTFQIYNEDEVREVNLSDSQKVRVDINGEPKDLYAFNCYVNSVQMADKITVALLYKEIGIDGGLVDPEEPVGEIYSVRQYIRGFRAKANDYDEKTRNLVKALGEYGHYAQQYLSELRTWTLGTEADGADHVAMDDYGYTPKTYSEAEKTAVTEALAANSGSAFLCSKIERVKTNLFLDTDTKVCLYFQPKSGYKGGASATVNGKTVIPKKANGRFVVEVPNIAAHRLGTTWTVKLTTSGLTTTVKVSALSYAQTILASSEDPKEINAMIALYNYSKAAKALV